MADKLPQRITTSPDVICQELDGEMVILDMQQEQYFGLNDVGTRMWQMLSQGHHTDQIVHILLGEFDIDETTLRGDLAALIHQLKEAKLARAAG